MIQLTNKLKTMYNIRSLFYKKNVASKLYLNIHANYQKSVTTPSLKFKKSEGTKLRKIFKWGFLVIPVTTFSMGIWQYRRKAWKEDIIEKVNSRLHQPAVEFPEDYRDLQDYEYRPVKLKGKFDHSKEVYIGFRSLMVDGKHKVNHGGLISQKSSVGYHVVTPFYLTNTGYPVLINRGWVQDKKKNPETRLEGQVEGEIEITGVFRKPEIVKSFTDSVDVATRVFNCRDIDKIAQYINTSPIFFDAVETIPGGPIGSQTKVALVNNHLAYMFTWFSFTGMACAMWYAKYVLHL